MDGSAKSLKDRRYKVGILGCGGIAQVHVWALNAIKGVELKAFCDVDIDKAKRLFELDRELKKNSGKNAEGCGMPQVEISDDWRSLLDSDLDVIHVCTPHHLHAPMAKELLCHGKAVFMEKPCAISVEQFGELQREDEAHPGSLGFCFQNRYNESTLLMDRIVREGRIGEIRGGRAMVTWRRDEEYYSESLWKGRIATEGGGALINQSIHTLDLLLRHLGRPYDVKGSIANHHLKETDVEVEDTVEAWMEFPGGARACFYASNAYATDAPVYLELQGTKGRICINGSEVSVYADGENPMHVSSDLAPGMGKDYWGRGHLACIEDFYDCLNGKAVYQNNLKGVENTFLTAMKIYEMARK
ncbi:MAG: Gfo/Idh/MocA family oxidoreductase [Lachnospiraceae bacterium]|nr:Gfo/Idh/MocA family oxidoreductase [Lachnospiraceae bacterium]